MPFDRPDKALVVKCTLDRQHNKRIVFPSARKCNYDILRHKVKQSFSLSSQNYTIQYKDDDEEIWEIKSDTTLTEAISYFSNGSIDDSSSAFSGFSLSNRKVTLKVSIAVDSDCISLSDTSSEISMEDYANRDDDYDTFQYKPKALEDLDDDSVTVSSRDTGSPSLIANSFRSAQESGTSNPATGSGSSPHTAMNVARSTAGRIRKIASSLSGRGRSVTELQASAAARFPENPSAVFERLRYEELNASDTSSIDQNAFDRSSRGAQWLRDQNERAIINVLGGLPSDSDEASSSLGSFEDDRQSKYSEFSGDLELQSDDRGKQYYSYNPARSSGSQFGDGAATYESDGLVDSSSLPDNNRPTSMQLNWLAAHQRQLMPSRSMPSIPYRNPDPLPLHNDEVPLELLQYLPPAASPPPEQVTECSSCGSRITYMRYICSSCGPKLHTGLQDNGSAKGKAREPPFEPHGLTYPPSHSHFGPPTISPSNSSRTLVGDLDFLGWTSKPQKPLPSLPAVSGSPGSSSGSSRSQYGPGYELCHECIYHEGVIHAREGAHMPSLPPSPQDSQHSVPSLRLKTRHAFQEKIWDHNGWSDVEHDVEKTSSCSFCDATHLKKSYRCISCKDLNVCRGCYSQIHEIHPLHAFSVIPERRVRSYSDPEHIPTVTIDHTEEDSMKHQGVKCSHCLQDIVGARFHCLSCESVDICSNCESAGLPGNLDSSDGGHTSAHMMIKIPYPLDSSEVHIASQRAINLWQHRDGVNISHSASDADLSSAASSYARTVIGAGASSLRTSPDDHGTICRGCNHPIVGIRYQCATCPSKPAPYSLCARCDERSWHVHNPYHVFLRFPRPVDKPLESAQPILPPLYQAPVAAGFNDLNNPKGYLRNLSHDTALCDCCMHRIQGEWFRCAYCGRDLCEECETNDEHDDTHIFMVLKAPIDMARFRVVFQNIDDPNGSTPIIPHAVYTKQRF